MAQLGITSIVKWPFHGEENVGIAGFFASKMWREMGTILL